jgi:hypothetical protein
VHLVGFTREISIQALQDSGIIPEDGYSTETYFILNEYLIKKVSLLGYFTAFYSTYVIFSQANITSNFY